jgi:Glutathione S-transferase, C-terminal domain
MQRGKLHLTGKEEASLQPLLASGGILSHDLKLLPTGVIFVDRSLSHDNPPRRHIHARLGAAAAFLGDRPFLLDQRPSTADTAVFGLLAPMVYWPMQTPVASHRELLRPHARAMLQKEPRGSEACLGVSRSITTPYDARAAHCFALSHGNSGAI